MVSFAVGIPVWQMVREAVNSLGGTAGRRQIIDYIESRHVHVNKGTISCPDSVVYGKQPFQGAFSPKQKSQKGKWKIRLFVLNKEGQGNALQTGNSWKLGNHDSQRKAKNCK